MSWTSGDLVPNCRSIHSRIFNEEPQIMAGIRLIYSMPFSFTGSFFSVLFFHCKAMTPSLSLSPNESHLLMFELQTWVLPFESHFYESRYTTMRVVPLCDHHTVMASLMVFNLNKWTREKLRNQKQEMRTAKPFEPLLGGSLSIAPASRSVWIRRCTSFCSKCSGTLKMKSQNCGWN